VPIAVAVLAEVELGRRSRRLSGRSPAAPELVVLEYLGMGLAVAASLAQTVLRGPAFGLLAVFLAAGLMAWGGLTQVRRRALFGALVSLVAVLLMLGAPVVRHIPHVHGAALWLGVAAIGTLLIVAATLIEQGKSKLKAAAGRLTELTAGWE
jgi:hypothetical protein